MRSKIRSFTPSGTTQPVDLTAVSIGRDHSSPWDSFWRGITPESEIRMWDFYGGRPWVLTHTPRFGRILEAGCGLGRYVFYLSRLGIDVEGLDSHEPTVRAVHQWAARHDFQCAFRVGDVAHLPFDTGSLSGYLSFGVVEHFQDSPTTALAEACRVLRPGGVAIISTPSVSFAQVYLRLRRSVSEIVKRLVGHPIVPEPFFQYWYTPHQLRSFLQACGLQVVLCGACDLKYTFWELGAYSGGRDLWFRVADLLERTPLAQWGAQALTVSVKVGDEMHCFLCGEKNVRSCRWHAHYLPICDRCSTSPVAAYYQRRSVPRFHGRWEYNPPLLLEATSTRLCYFCEQPVRPDRLFEDFGFRVPICRECLRIPARNLVASNEFLQPRWRPRERVTKL